MIFSRQAVLLLAGACTAAVCGLTACDKAPAKAGAGTQESATAKMADQAVDSQLKAPPLPDPSRTDPEAVAMRKKYVDWKVAQVNAANAVAQKQVDQFNAGPAPKGNYGRMADGLPKSADQK